MAPSSRQHLDRDIYLIDGFITPDVCATILDELETVLWRKSLTYQREDNGTYRNVLSPMRVSDTAHQDFFGPILLDILTTIENRIEQEAGVDSQYLEWWQATSYVTGGSFDYHLDAGYWDEHHAGDRVLTFLLYLDTPTRGGETHFRAKDLMVEARTGRLLVWQNLFENGSANHQLIHSGAPVLEGTKTTLVTWQRQKPFRTASAAQVEKELIER